jgi:hypothetical protein
MRPIFAPLLAFTLFAGAPVPAATRDDPPEREMLEMMEFLREMEMIKQVDMLRDMSVIEAGGDQATKAPPQKSSPPRKKEIGK